MIERRWNGTKERSRNRSYKARIKRLAEQGNTYYYILDERYIGNGEYEPVEKPYVVKGMRTHRGHKGSYQKFKKDYCNRKIRRMPIGNEEEAVVLNYGSYRKANEFWWDIE